MNVTEAMREVDDSRLRMHCGYEIPNDLKGKEIRVFTTLQANGFCYFNHDDGPDLVSADRIRNAAEAIGLMCYGSHPLLVVDPEHIRTKYI